MGVPRKTNIWWYVGGIASVASLLLLGVVWMSSVSLEPTAPSVTHELPGLRWTGPDWEVSVREDRFDFGRRILARGNDRFISFRWVRGRPESREELELRASTKQKVVNVEEVSVSGHTGYRFELTMPDGTDRQFATHWFCAENSRNQSIATFLPLDRNGHRERHVAHERSVECHVPFDGVRPRIVFPVVATPVGFERFYNAESFSLINEGEREVFIFPHALPGSEIAAKLVTHAELVKPIIANVLEKERFTVEEKPTVVDEPGGERTALWEGTATLKDGEINILFAAWACAKNDIALVGLYFGPQDKPITNARKTLLGASCP